MDARRLEELIQQLAFMEKMGQIIEPMLQSSPMASLGYGTADLMLRLFSRRGEFTHDPRGKPWSTWKTMERLGKAR